MDTSKINTETGGISVAREHIFPVIKKWLYSDKEIFLREIVSNASDAIIKLGRLESLSEYDSNGESYRIDVTLDSENKTLTVSDNGIGMNADEVRKYICSIALSGALDFIKKYEGDNEQSGIIGHFGLGFYSAFMVSSSVEVVTRSIDGSGTIRWICDENGEYTMSETDRRETHGTDIIMHINDEGKEFLSKYKLTEVLNRYCAFMPVGIYLHDKADDEKKDDGKEKEDEKPINDIDPLWKKLPSQCSEEEYNEFYKKLFSDWREPLFHIHINADYPLNFKGILYFPKLTSKYESLEGQVKLFYNQVFVADNIKEVIPDYLIMFRGALDCPELPLNVSRSYLQNSAYAAKLAQHIAKKTADEINGMMNTEREKLESIWKDLRVFCEYGSLKDSKFFDRIKKSILFETTTGKYMTADEYIDSTKETNEGKIYYTTDKVAQASYVSLFEEQGIPVVVLGEYIDTQFITLVENDKKVRFLRIDSDVADALRAGGDAEEDPGLTGLFRKVSGLEALEVKYENLKDGSIPAILTVSEESRRMADMMRVYGGGELPAGDNDRDMILTVNSSSELIKSLCASENDDAKEKAARQIYTLALLSIRTLTPEELRTFISGSIGILKDIL